MGEPGDRKNGKWVSRSILFLAAMSVASLLVGFVLLPGTQGDFSAQGIWASICRAAGVPLRRPAGDAATALATRSTTVLLDRSMQRPADGDAVGRGATLALQCTMCHGARGLSEANAPNLAGQYEEVIVKQLLDFRHGDRQSAIMQALTRNLSERDTTDLAAYYAYLPRPSIAGEAVGDMPALVRVGDPMRNVAPCASCHGGIDHKLGAPWLEGMPREYLGDQLRAFAQGVRTNDSHAQMRNMARSLSAQEIASISAFYAGRTGGPGGR